MPSQSAIASRSGASIKVKLAVLAVVVPLVSGCVYPVHKTLQPAAEVKVVDANQQPISGASVTLVSNTYASGFEKTRVERRTDGHGQAEFQAKKEWRREVLFLHGREAFFWNICAQKTGYKTFRSDNLSVDDFSSPRTIRLTPGTSSSCSGATTVNHE